jgi:hypothetical protein
VSTLLDLFFDSEQSAQAAIARFLAERRQNDAADWTAPDLREAPPPLQDWSVQWSSLEELEELSIPAPQFSENAIPVERLRAYFPRRIEHLITSHDNKLHLIIVPPGAGKTYAAVHAAQDSGARILWLSPRHDGFDNIAATIPGFRAARWHYWLAMSTPVNDDGETACRLFEGAMLPWLTKGYPAGQLCYQLCPTWQHQCPFRVQSRLAKQKPIVFARHQHLITGLNAGTFDAVIIDENPLNVFISERIIPPRGLAVGDTSPVTVDLARKLQALAARGETLKARKFLEQIETELTNVYALADLDYDVLPDAPRVTSAADVHAAPYWYLYDFLRLIDQEYRAYTNDWPRWESRCWIDSNGLHLIDRARVAAKMPDNVIVLDATAHPPLYQQMFPGVEVDIFRPAIARRGRVFQIINRTNGTERMKESAADMLATVRAFVAYHDYRKVGIVCHKAVEAIFKDADFETLHFGALRGENRFQNVDALFVVGAPSPPGESIRRQAVALAENIAPLADSAHTVTRRAYPLLNSDRIPHRPVSGYFDNEVMETLHEQFRTVEMAQAIYRARPLTNDCDIWLLSAIPTVEIDALYTDPRAALGGKSEYDWISWQDYVRLVPFLVAHYRDNLPFGYAEIGEALGYNAESEERVKRRAQRGGWLEKITEIWGGRVAPAVFPGQRGRPPNHVTFD